MRSSACSVKQLKEEQADKKAETGSEEERREPACSPMYPRRMDPQKAPASMEPVKAPVTFPRMAMVRPERQRR